MVRYYLLEPRRIDVNAIEQATKAAGYTPATIRVEFNGQAVRGAGGLRFKVEKTGQLFLIQGKIANDGLVVVRGEIVKGVGAEPILKIETVKPVGGAPREKPAAKP